MAATCRSCGANVTWVVTHKGKRMPIDLIAREDGNLVIDVVVNGVPTVRYVDPKQPSLEARERYVSHFVSCPDRTEWRRSDDG